jgi:hypothetical protein
MTIELVWPTATEQTRARYPDAEGYVERDGIRHFEELYGSGDPTVRLMPAWSFIHSRHWKMQIPNFGPRHHLAETIGPLLDEGKGRRPQTPRPRRPAAAS